MLHSVSWPETETVRSNPPLQPQLMATVQTRPPLQITIRTGSQMWQSLFTALAVWCYFWVTARVTSGHQRAFRLHLVTQSCGSFRLILTRMETPTSQLRPMGDRETAGLGRYLVTGTEHSRRC